DSELGLLAEDDLLWADVRAAELEGHVEPRLLVEALGLGGVEPGELGLRHPLELEGHLGCLLPRATGVRESRRHQARDGQEQGGNEIPPASYLHELSLLNHSVVALTEGCQLSAKRSARAIAA